MPNLKTNKILAPERQILALPDHYVNVTGKIAFATLAGLSKDTGDGQGKVIHRGTLVHLKATGEVVACTADLKPNAVVFNTITSGDFDSGTDDFINATLLIHGFVRKDRLVEVTATHGTAALLSNAMIYVMEN